MEIEHKDLCDQPSVDFISSIHVESLSGFSTFYHNSAVILGIAINQLTLKGLKVHT
jgi:hypothetical protein